MSKELTYVNFNPVIESKLTGKQVKQIIDTYRTYVDAIKYKGTDSNPHLEKITTLKNDKKAKKDLFFLEKFQSVFRYFF